MSLVTMAMAALHLRESQYVDEDASPLVDNPDMVMKLAQAEAIILDYMKVEDESPEPWGDWTDRKVAVVQSAILIQLLELWRFRGDDPGSAQSMPVYADGQLSPAITALLRRYRDPALA